jgi:hypothetical protein
MKKELIGWTSLKLTFSILQKILKRDWKNKIHTGNSIYKRHIYWGVGGWLNTSDQGQTQQWDWTMSTW